MTNAAPRAQVPPQPKSFAKVVIASLIGTTIEWYDFFLYGSAAALVFNKLFFPTANPLTGTLLAFTTYAIGFLARPLGGLVFGHFGDKLGRKKLLVLSLVLMGGATFAMGLLPTYAMIGLAAPLLLTFLRLVQGFALGGEWGGAVLIVSEHGSAERRGFWASWPQAGVPLGNLLATAVLAVLAGVQTDEAFLSWGWRVPFLLSGVLVLIGLWIRLSVSESPVFLEAQRKAEAEKADAEKAEALKVEALGADTPNAEARQVEAHDAGVRKPDAVGAKEKAPIVTVVREHWREVLIAMGARMAENVSYYVITAFILVYITAELGLPRSTGLNAVLIASAVHLVAIPLWGALSDRIGRRATYLIGAVGMGLWMFVFFALLDTRSFLPITLAVTGGLVLHGAMYGPQAAFFSELFGTKVRYSGASVGYQLASIGAGAVAPLIATALLAAYDSSFPIVLYVLAMCVITVVAVLVAKETKGTSLDRTATERASVSA